MGTTVSFPRTDGGGAQGYLAEAAEPAGPGVVVIQEWWGLQGQIRAVCDRFAADGLTALAPDLYGGKVVPYHDAGGASAAMAALDLVGATDQVVRGAVRHLAARGGKVGIAGFCMGGAVTVIGAVRVPELSAAVCFYGIPPDAAARPEDVRVPLQGHFAAQDDWCTPAVVDAFEERLRRAGKTFELYRYPGRHAFMNSERPEVHDPSQAKLAWERCVSFLASNLRG